MTTTDARKMKYNVAPGQSFTSSVLGRQTEDVESQYKFGRKLGQGQFGTTYLVTERSTGEQYACKSIPKKKLISADDVGDVKREVAIMHHLAGHPNIVKIRGAFEDPAAVHIVMELCSGGELFDRIIAKGHYRQVPACHAKAKLADLLSSEAKAAALTRTIVGVVETCHSLGVMHRDLKPENFLLLNEHEDSALKATDFGLSMFFKPGHPWIAKTGVAPDKPLDMAFLAATVHLNKIEREETLFAAFSYFDTDNSGFISIDELRQACKEYNMDEEAIMETMKDVDTNNTGSALGGKEGRF
eukprot:jgi/Mesen1/6861/ME000351S05983